MQGAWNHGGKEPNQDALGMPCLYTEDAVESATSSCGGMVFCDCGGPSPPERFVVVDRIPSSTETVGVRHWPACREPFGEGSFESLLRPFEKSE